MLDVLLGLWQAHTGQPSRTPPRPMTPLNAVALPSTHPPPPQAPSPPGAPAWAARSTSQTPAWSSSPPPLSRSAAAPLLLPSRGYTVLCCAPGESFTGAHAHYSHCRTEPLHLAVVQRPVIHPYGISAYMSVLCPAVAFVYGRYEGGNALAMARQFGLYYGNMTLEQFRAAFKPYMYGFITETKIQLDGSTIPQVGVPYTRLLMVTPCPAPPDVKPAPSLTAASCVALSATMKFPGACQLVCCCCFRHAHGTLAQHPACHPIPRPPCRSTTCWAVSPSSWPTSCPTAALSTPPTTEPT